MNINHNRPSNTQSSSVSHKEAIGDFLIASLKCEVVNLKRLLDSVQLVDRIRTLVHQLQRERGASCLWIGSGGQRYACELTQYRSESNSISADFHDRRRWTTRYAQGRAAA